jgi:SAM-dependent methyltransferase
VGPLRRIASFLATVRRSSAAASDSQELERYSYAYTGEKTGPAHVDAGLRSQWTAHYMIYRLFIDEPFLHVPTLDIASGSGAGTKLLALSSGKRAIGIDYSPDAVAYARSKNASDRVSYEQVDVTEAAGLDAVRDIVAREAIEQAFFIEGMEHIPFEATDRLIALLLNSGVRRIRISTPFERVEAASANEHHISPMTPLRFEQFANRWGARVVRYLRFLEVPRVDAMIDAGRTEEEILTAFSTDDVDDAGSYLLAIDASASPAA